MSGDLAPLAHALCATPVAVIGVGNMGLGIALRLRDAGQALRVHDLRADRMALATAAGAGMAGADWAATPADAARGCSLLIVVVVDAAQTDAVLFGPAGAAAALAPGAAVMLCPTIAPVDVEAFALRLAALGLGCIDAPMSGGPVRARLGEMSLMVACPDVLWRAQQPLLQQLAARLFHVGTRPGDGARTKLVNNLLAAVNLAAAAEAIALAQGLGLDGAQTLAVIEQSSGQSWIGSDRLARALAGDFAPRAHTTLLAKDSALALAMAAQAGLRPLLGTQAAAMFQAALLAGFGAEDDARLLSLIGHQWAAAQARTTPPASPTSPDPA